MTEKPSYLPEDELLFDDEIGEFIEECLSTSDSDDTPIDNYIEQPNAFSAFEQVPPQLITSSVSSMAPVLANTTVVSPASIWPMCDSSRGGSSSGDESVTGEKKVERRKRNREHAKKSRMRKKQFHEDLLVSVSLLQDENEKLRSLIRQRFGDTEANRVLCPENLQKMRLERGTVHTARALISNKTLTLRLPEEHSSKKHVTISIIS